MKWVQYIFLSSVTIQVNGRMTMSCQPSLYTKSKNNLMLSAIFLHRLYFTLKMKAGVMSVTVSPCDLSIEWSLAARTLKDKPLKSMQCE